MKNKTCRECRYMLNNDTYNVCTYSMSDAYVLDNACRHFAPLTNGDLIIAGGMRELAKAMVYGYRETDDNGQVTDGMLYTWHLPNAKVFTEYNEAVDYLEDWLNAPAGKDTNVPANESEGKYVQHS